MKKTTKPKAPRRHVESWWEAIAPIDYRYYREEVFPYLSVFGAISYQARFQCAIAKILRPESYEKMLKACEKVNPTNVYRQEAKIRHDVQALIDMINWGEDDDIKTITNFCGTSYDTICSADAARIKDFTIKVLIPALNRLLKALSDKALRYAETRQIGRSHLQHATPVTVGFALAKHLEDLGDCRRNLRRLTSKLVGKYSGPVGTHAGLSTVVDNPKEVERLVLKEMGLKPARISSQITSSLPMTRLCTEIINLSTLLADLAEDMRLLSMTEVGEISEPFIAGQVGSAGMPHKDNNPISYENIIGMWMTVMPKIITVFMSNISNFQRDLRNSVPMRIIPELFAYTLVAVETMTKAMSGVKVNEVRVAENFRLKGDRIMAEQLKIILMDAGHPRAYRVSQALAKKAKETGDSLYQLAMTNRALKPYIAKAKPKQLACLKDPARYIGTAIEETRTIADQYSRVTV